MDIAAAESQFVRADAHLNLHAAPEHASHLPPQVPVSLLWMFSVLAQAVCVDESNPDPVHGCSMCYPTYEDIGPLRVPTGYYCLHEDP